jgi:hypothetical protein
MEQTTLKIASTGLIYTPGIFAWIENEIPFNKKQAKKLLAALGIPAEFIPAILNGKYKKWTEGETLVLALA